MRHTRKLIAVLTSAALALSACGNDDENSTEAIDASSIPVADYLELDRDEIQDGGSLTTAIGEISDQQNPFHANGTAYTSTLWSWYNPVLLLSTPEGEVSPNPDYLTDISDAEEDGNTVVTYTINDQAEFNDGTPIDWRAFETTWLINNGESDDYVPSSTDGYEQIADVSAGDNEKEAVVTFDGLYPWWETMFSYIAHPALADPANYNSYVQEVHPEWGAGPFKVENVDFNRGEATFVPNEQWWGNEPKLDRRVFRQMETQAAINAFRNGEIDATGVADRDRYSNVQDMSGIEIRVGRATRNSLYLLNGSSDILQDITVREAVATALDREQLSKIWFQGLPYSETPPGSFTLYSFQDDYEDNFSAVASYDPDKAAELLDEAGWTEDGEYRSKDGKPLTLRYALVGESEQTNADARATQQMLGEVGINLEITTFPSSEFSRIWESKDYDIFPMGFSSSAADGVSSFGQLYLSDSGLNASDTGTPELDAKIREMQKLSTKEEQTERANELEKEALALFGIIPMTNGADIVAIKEGLANYGPMGFGRVPIENIGWKA